MPIYDYICSACGDRSEFVHGIHDPGPRFCPQCGAEGTMSKGFVTPAIHFKGTGWAKKDRSASSSAGSRAAAKGGAEAADGGAASDVASKPGDTADVATAPKGTDGSSSAATTKKQDSTPASTAGAAD